jgi:hypothetical protein
MSLFFDETTERVIRKPEVVEWEWGEPVKLCGTCHVRINNLPDKYDRVYCNNGHLNVRPS